MPKGNNYLRPDLQTGSGTLAGFYLVFSLGTP